MSDEKLVILKFYSDIETGFLTVLEIEPNGMPKIEASGRLPPPIQVVQFYQQWQTDYRNLGQNLRSLKPRQVRNLGLKQRKLRCRDSAQALQQALNQWLRADSFLTIREALLKHVSLSDQVRLIIRSQETTIWQLPWHQWEFLRDYDNIEVSFSTLQFGAAIPSQPAATAAHSLKILVVLGDATGINVQEDRRLFNQISSGSAIDFLVEPKREALIERLQNHSYDFLFFAGHSRTERGLGFIDLNSTDSLTLEELQTRLKLSIQKGLQLAIFNSCDGLGLVKALEHLQIPCLIVMREPIPDAVAQAFLKAFLQALSRGTPFHLAAREAREELQKFEDAFPCASWLPMIWQSSSAVPSWGGSLARSPVIPSVKPKRRVLCSLWGRFKIPIAMSLISTAVIIGLRLSGVLQSAELVTFDHLMSLRPNEGTDPNLLIVEVTQADIEAQKQNHEQMQRRSTSAQTLGETFDVSLSDASLNQLLTVLAKYKPRVIGLDIYRDFPAAPNQPRLVQHLQSLPLITICKVGDRDDPNIPTIDPAPEVPLNRIGFSDFQTDSGVVLRRQLLGMFPEQWITESVCKVEQSFSLQIATAYLKQEGIVAKLIRHGDYDDLRLGNRLFPVLRSHTSGYQALQRGGGGSQILLNYRATPKVAASYSLTEMLKGDFNGSYIKDKIVLIGVTASDDNHKDYWTTPYSVNSGEQMAGVVVHAHMISQLINAAHRERPLFWFWSPLQELVWIGAWTFLGGLAVWKIGHRSLWRWLPRWGLAITLLISLLYSLCFGVLLGGGWIPFIPSALGILLCGSSVAVYKQAITKSIKKFSMGE